MDLKRLVTPFSPAEGMPSWWASLFERSATPSIFLSDMWLGTWIEVYGTGFGGQWVRWEENGIVIAGCLLAANVVRRRLIPMRSLYLNATGEAVVRTPTAGFNDVLCVPGREDAIAADFAQFLLTEKWDRLVLEGFDENGVVHRLIPKVPTALIEREARPGPYVDLVAIQGKSFEGSLSANSRGQIRRSRKLYAERWGEVTVTPAQSLDEALAFLASLAELHNARWEGRGMKGSFAHKHVVDFHQRFIRLLWPRNMVELLRVRAGNEDLGYLYNFLVDGKVLFFQSGFSYTDAEDARYKPGLVTHTVAIEHYQGRGFKEYDFLAGEARYKRSLGKSLRSLCWAVIYRQTLRMSVLLWLRRRFVRADVIEKAQATAEVG